MFSKFTMLVANENTPAALRAYTAEKDRPVLLLSHRPTGLAEAKEMEVDLELSGHTHHGQLFPANLMTSMIYDVSYGHMQDGNFQIIVSSGYGTWGYPIRTGSWSEMVRIQAAFR